MTDSVNLKAEDRAIRHAVFLVRLRNGEANSIAKLYNTIIPDIRSEIEQRVSSINFPGVHRPSKQRILRLKQLETVLKEQIASIEFLKVLRENLQKVALTEAESQIRILESVTPKDLGISFSHPSTALLRSMVTSRPFDGQVLREWTKANAFRSVNLLMREINTGLTRGESIPDISGRVQRQLLTSKSNAQAITRTAVNHVSTQARELTYEHNDDVVKGVKFVATLDNRTTLTCASLDGKVFNVGEGPRPPMHFNCRSTTVPVLKSWEELGISAKELTSSTRASMNGEVPETQTYPQWLKRQPQSVQREVLGTSRFEKFKETGNIEPFVDNQFRPISIEELRRREVLN